MEKIFGNVKVEWVELGEGLDGDYDETNPEDEELLRFDVSVLINNEWVEVENASYCTRFPVNATIEEKEKGLILLLNAFYPILSNDVEASVKRKAEEMSWISLEWVKDALENQENVRNLLSVTMIKSEERE